MPLSDAEVDQLIEDTEEFVSDVGDDTDKLTQEESAEFYEALGAFCQGRASMIRKEMADAQRT